MPELDYGSALPAEDAPRPGEVWLVGAGPGDPGLLTLRAAEALRRADLVLHDALPGRGVLRLVGAGATILAVGKRKGFAPLSQAKINARLIAGARAGQRVVRLKGGDPFVFGRGGEEAQALAAAGIPWRVVPGVSAGIAAPAAAGIPLTHRGVASAVTFVTGHDEAGGVPESVDWAALAHAGGTIAAFMALSRLDEIALRLLTAGRSPATPVAVVAQASFARADGAAHHSRRLHPRRPPRRHETPALVLIGEVVGLSPRRCVRLILPHPRRCPPPGHRRTRLNQYGSNGRRYRMTLQLGQVAPDFEADTTLGRIRFHDWLGSSWAVLFSHPKDYTPVCTTELGETARLKPEFDRRGVKVIGLSVDPVDSHKAWGADIAETQGHAVNFPMIADPEKTVANLYGMVHPEAGPGDHRAYRLRDRPAEEGAAAADLPALHGEEFRRDPAGDRQPAADRREEGRDAGELAAGRAGHHPALGPGRGGDVAVPPGLGGEEALPALRRRQIATLRAGAPPPAGGRGCAGGGDGATPDFRQDSPPSPSPSRAASSASPSPRRRACTAWRSIRGSTICTARGP